MAQIYFSTKKLDRFSCCLIQFITGAAARTFRKAKENEIEEAIAEVLRNAPHRPGGSKYMVKSVWVLAFNVCYPLIAKMARCEINER